MKLIIEPSTKKIQYKNNLDGLILSLKDYSVQSSITYTLEEIKKVIEENPTLEIFVNMNKTFLNKEIKELENTLLELDKLKIQGILFYDLAIVKLKKDHSLKIDLVWNQTHMVNNYKTCNYYYEKGVKYALLGKEITEEEIIEIKAKSQIIPLVEVVSYPSVAFSRRKLITNYYKDIEKTPKKELNIQEKITNKNYLLTEDKNGTSFFLMDLMNATSIIKNLYEKDFPYIVMREYKINSNLFEELVKDTKKYIEGNCQEEAYINKYKKLGSNTNFFHQKTVYQVKKNEKN